VQRKTILARTTAGGLLVERGV